MENENLQKEINELKNQITDLKKRELSRSLRLKRWLKISLITALLTFSVYGLAVITQLHVFSAGEVISAQKINENFAYLESLISSGGGGGGVTVEAITSQQTKTLTSTDHN